MYSAYPMVEESAVDECFCGMDGGCHRTVDRSGLISIRLQVYTFVVTASLSSTYFRVRLRKLLAAASVSSLNPNRYKTVRILPEAKDYAKSLTNWGNAVH